MAFRVETVATQQAALRRVAELIAKGSIDPTVRRAAKAITRGVPARNDLAELQALYNAVKTGTPNVAGLSKGMRYVSDPTAADFFQGAKASLEECKAGACAGDCDDQTILIGSLAAALGFTVGARAYAVSGSRSFSHVYAVAAVPKHGPWPKNYAGHGLDTTVPKASVGWDPPGGSILTYWVE